MGDTSIAQDIISGVADALGDVGDTRTLRIVTPGTIDPSNPGAGATPTNADVPVEAIIVDYEERYIDGTLVLAGDKQAVIDLSALSSAQIAGIKPGNFLIDGSVIYKILRPKKYEVAGIPVAVVVQMREA
jgi:hypothetical protein